MALNIETLKTRTITAIFFLIIMLVGLFTSKWAFVLLFTIVALGAGYEFFKLSKKIWITKYQYYFFISLFYIALPVLLFVDLGINKEDNAKMFSYSPIIPCAIIFSIWINDTMAYFVGSLIGKTPLSSISPKKTWEGTIGGIVLAVIIIGFGSMFFKTHLSGFPKLFFFIIALISAVFGTIGDLVESKIKRLAGVKDSGTFMPGHGGFLDRFDSLLLAAPAVWLYVKSIQAF